HLIREDLGYELHRSVQRVKCELSEQPEARFRFSDGVIEIEAKVTRREFEEWIGEGMAQIEECVGYLMQDSRVARQDVDMVLLTGRSSFVAAVRRIFEGRFGAARIRSGNEFTSVARGLALKAAERRREPLLS